MWIKLIHKYIYISVYVYNLLVFYKVKKAKEEKKKKEIKIWRKEVKILIKLKLHEVQQQKIKLNKIQKIRKKKLWKPIVFKRAKKKNFTLDYIFAMGAI